jgi:hypothetical protein
MSAGAEPAEILATITLHLPGYRARSLKMQTDHREAELAYDRQIGAFVEFLQREGARAGIRVDTDQRDHDAVFTIDAADRDRKKAAHDWLDQQPDIWNWMP